MLEHNILSSKEQKPSQHPENSNAHKECVFQWREAEFRLKNSSTVHHLLDTSLKFIVSNFYECHSCVKDKYDSLG